ncbi:MAG: hypothetical protein V4525_14235 [Pseudomonadota bacterium]
MSRKTFTLFSTIALMGLVIIGCSSNSSLIQPAASGSDPIIAITRPSQENQSQYQARLHTELAAAYYSRKQYQVSLEEIDQALKFDSSYAPAYGMMALIHGTLGDDKGAESAFNRALQFSPNDPDIRNNFGAFLCERRRFRESLVHFDYALRSPLYQTPQVALRNAAECAFKGGDKTRAAGFYQKLGEPMPQEAPLVPNAASTLAIKPAALPQPEPAPLSATAKRSSAPVQNTTPLPLEESIASEPVTEIIPAQPIVSFKTAPRASAPIKNISEAPESLPTPAPASRNTTKSSDTYQKAQKAYDEGDLLNAQDTIKLALQMNANSPEILHLAMCIERRFANIKEEEYYAGILLQRYPQSMQARSLNTTNRGCS